jgi:hypothetical protein
MHLEQIGQSINLLFPIAASLSYLYTLHAEQSRLEEKLHTLTVEARKRGIAKKKHDAFIRRYLGAPSDYLERALSSISLLSQETARLTEALSHPAFPDKEKIGRRLAAIREQERHLRFEPVEIRRAENVVETVERQTTPVDVSLGDLEKIVFALEAPPIVPGERPQIWISDFSLVRSPSDTPFPIYTLQIEVLQREYYSKLDFYMPAQ